MIGSEQFPVTLRPGTRCVYCTYVIGPWNDIKLTADGVSHRACSRDTVPR